MASGGPMVRTRPDALATPGGSSSTLMGGRSRDGSRSRSPPLPARDARRTPTTSPGEEARRVDHPSEEGRNAPEVDQGDPDHAALVKGPHAVDGATHSDEAIEPSLPVELPQRDRLPGSLIGQVWGAGPPEAGKPLAGGPLGFRVRERPKPFFGTRAGHLYEVVRLVGDNEAGPGPCDPLELAHRSGPESVPDGPRIKRRRRQGGFVGIRWGCRQLHRVEARKIERPKRPGRPGEEPQPAPSRRRAVRRGQPARHRRKGTALTAAA